MQSLEEQINSFANYSESRNNIKHDEAREDSIDRILREAEIDTLEDNLRASEIDNLGK